MKNNYFKKAMLVALGSLTMCLTIVGCNSSNSDDVTVDEYGIQSDEYGPKMLIKVHNAMIEKHTFYVSYSNWAKYEKDQKDGTLSIDTSASDQTKNVSFYTGKLFNKGTTLTREHVWACANSTSMWTHNSSDGSHYVDGAGYKGGGSDLYHIRPCDGTLNTKRGNGLFYEFKEGDTVVEHREEGGLYTLKTDREDDYAALCEPDDHFKGDVARILVYVYVHYTNIGTLNDYTGALNLKNVFPQTYTMNDIYDLLVRWNELDPADEDEKLRNDQIEKIQGNRNPFVDHPDYMRRIFGLVD